MSIDRVKPENWAFAETLTSTQLNQLDTNAASALDKRSGQTDTLASDITVSGDIDFDASTLTGEVSATLSSSTITLASSSTLTSNGPVVLSSTSTVSKNGQSAKLLCGVNIVETTSAQTIASPASAVDITGASITFSNCVIGDVVIIDARVPVYTDTVAGTQNVRIAVVDGPEAIEFPIGNTYAVKYTSSGSVANISTMYTVTVGGSLQVKLTGTNSGGGDMYVGSSETRLSLRAQHFRI